MDIVLMAVEDVARLRQGREILVERCRLRRRLAVDERDFPRRFGGERGERRRLGASAFAFAVSATAVFAT